MKNRIKLICLLFIYSSCNVANNSSSSIKLIDGYSYYEQTSPKIKIQLYGDYLFQPLKTKYFRDVDKKFIKYIENKYNNTSPKRLFQAHTIVQPFYSSVCLQYKTNLLDTLSLNEIKIQLKSQLNTGVSEFEKIRVGLKDVYKIKYQTTNSVNKIYSSHTEYFFKKGEFVYRFFFWTIESNDEVISYEAEAIIKNISFD
jgi:hypothetical protein